MATRLSSSKARSAPSSTHRARGGRRVFVSVDPDPASYARTDPFTALNTLRTLLAALPARTRAGSGQGAYTLAAEEHKLALHLLAIVEPFVGLSPSRRTLTRQPTEILDAIAFHLDARQDLLALALSCRRMHAVVFPRHYDYRVVRCKASALAVWSHLTVHRGLARNVRRLEILDERSTEPACVPTGIAVSDTDLESSDDELVLHAKQERFLVGALARMTALKSFTWSCGHLPISLDSLWATLVKCQGLCQVRINDNTLFVPPVGTSSEDSNDEGGAKSKRQSSVFPALKSVSLNAAKYTYGATKNPDMTRISTMLASCPVLESLDIEYTPRRTTGFSYPIIDDFLLCSRWPSLRTLVLTNLWCSSQAGFDATTAFLLSHPQLETLHLDVPFGGGGGNAVAHRQPLTLPPNCLPRLKEARCSKEVAGAILGCPCDTPGGRPLETIKGVRLSGSAWDKVFLANLKDHGTHVKRVELTGWNEMDDIKRLVDSAPQLTWLDVGRRTGSAAVAQAGQSRQAAPPISTNFAEWAAILSQLPGLATFHGVRFFYEVAQGAGQAGAAGSIAPLTLSDRSRVRKNDEVASLLAWKCPKLRRLDHWEEGSGKVIVLLRDGDKVRYEVRRVKV